MLLVVRRARHAGNNSEDGAESIVHAVDCVGHPTAAAAVPAFAFQNGVERAPSGPAAAPSCSRRARALFLRARLRAKTSAHRDPRSARSLLRSVACFVTIFRSLPVSANRNFRVSRYDLHQRLRRCRTMSARSGGAKPSFPLIFAPSERHAAFCLGRSNRIALRFSSGLALGEVAINARGLHFGAPLFVAASSASSRSALIESGVRSAIDGINRSLRLSAQWPQRLSVLPVARK